MADTILFYVFSALAVAASALVIGQRNPMYSVVWLIVSFFAVAALFVQLDAPFLAMAQVIIYAGAIMVLFLFVVMLLNASREDAAEWDRTHPLRRPGAARVGTILAVLFVADIAWALSKAVALHAPVGSRADASTVTSIRELGRVLFTEYS